ncbi:hypothetical protein H0H93_010455, partial [Arthromyces matolae]
LAAATKENSDAFHTASPNLEAATSWHANSENRHHDADGNRQSRLGLALKATSGNSGAQQDRYRNIKSVTGFFSRLGMPSLSPSLPMLRSETIQIRHKSLDQKHLASFYCALPNIPDEETLDKAIQALPSLLLNTKRSFCHKHSIYATPDEVLALRHLLSLDLPFRFNLAAAEHISTSVHRDYSQNLPAVVYHSNDVADLIEALCFAAQRDSATHVKMTKTISHVLDSILVQADLLSDLPSVPTKVPLLALLSVPFFSLPLDHRHQRHVQLQVVNHVYGGLQDMLAEGHKNASDPPRPKYMNVLYIVRQMGVEVQSLFPLELWSTYDAQSVPFLLNILPINLDKDRDETSSISFLWFCAFLQLCFSSSARLPVVVKSVFKVVEYYHRNRSCFDKTRSRNLRATIDTIIDRLKNSLDDREIELASGWRPVFEACLLIVRHMFPIEQITELYDATDLRWCLQIVIPILKHITQMVPFAQLQEEFLLPSDLKDILRSETANAVLRRVDDEQVKGAELLEIFRSIDPSL